MLALLVVAAISTPSPAYVPPRSGFSFWSVGAAFERNGAERTIAGPTFKYVVYWDSHAPPMTFYVGGEILSGEGQDVVRGSGTFSLLAFPAGQHFSFWVRPFVGLEYRRSEPDDGFGALAAIGGEFIIRPRGWMQIALSVDRLFSTLGTSNQAGLAFRWGKKRT